MSSSALRAGVKLWHEEIRVEELVNYHRHEISLPSYDQRVALDVRCEEVDGKPIFQIGLATHRDVVQEFRTPLNLVLVIDRSGSMNGKRIRKVKESLLALSKKLRPRDLISIVTYSDDAAVCIEATSASNLKELTQAISSIKAGGSTNLHAGLTMGYEIALQQFDDQRANRVILLTDGLANRGVTDVSQIVAESKTFNQKGIGLSTIGLGNSLNRHLLRQLSDAGKGAMHFIADASDIRKVFIDEFDSLLSPAAQDVEVLLRFSDSRELKKIYGYTPVKQEGYCYRIAMENMNYGATQVIVGKLASIESTIDVQLNFFDAVLSKKVRMKKTISFEKTSNFGHDRTKDSSTLKKNYSIAKVAQAIKKSAEFAEAGKYSKAEKRLNSAIRFARTNFPQQSDPDVDRVCNIASKQRASVKRIASNR